MLVLVTVRQVDEYSYLPTIVDAWKVLVTYCFFLNDCYFSERRGWKDSQVLLENYKE